MVKYIYIAYQSIDWLITVKFFGMRNYLAKVILKKMFSSFTFVRFSQNLATFGLIGWTFVIKNDEVFIFACFCSTFLQRHLSVKRIENRTMSLVESIDWLIDWGK